MTAMEKAQHNLCSQLGFLENAQKPLGHGMAQYVALFDGPPQAVIAVLIEIDIRPPQHRRHPKYG